MTLGFFARTVSMSLFWRAASKPASVSATTSMPSRPNSSLAPLPTAADQSEVVCQDSAAVNLPSLTLASCSGVSVTEAAGVAASPCGPLVVVSAASTDPAASQAAVSMNVKSRLMGSSLCFLGSILRAAVRVWIKLAQRTPRRRHLAASSTDFGASRLSDSLQPSATFCLVTVMAGATTKGGACLPSRP